MTKCPDCTLPVLRSEGFCVFCNHRLKKTGDGAKQIGHITFRPPKGSQLEMAVRHYVVTRFATLQNAEIKRLGRVEITAEYVPQDGTSLRTCGPKTAGLRSEVVGARP